MEQASGYHQICQWKCYYKPPIPLMVHMCTHTAPQMDCWIVGWMNGWQDWQWLGGVGRWQCHIMQQGLPQRGSIHVAPLALFNSLPTFVDIQTNVYKYFRSPIHRAHWAEHRHLPRAGCVAVAVACAPPQDPPFKPFCGRLWVCLCCFCYRHRKKVTPRHWTLSVCF